MANMIEQLKLPNAQDFMTLHGAAAELGVTWLTVKRYIAAGRLSAYWAIGGPGEQRPTMVAAAEVRALAAARKLMQRRP